MTRSNVRLENFRNAFISLQFELASRQPVAFEWLVKDGGVRGLAKQYVEIQRHIAAHFAALYEKIEAEHKALHPQEETPAVAETVATPNADEGSGVTPDPKAVDENKENVEPESTPSVEKDIVGID